MKLILCVALTLGIGALAGLATSSSIAGWYLGINKPSFNPPNYLFGPVWTCLYCLLGVSLYLILESRQPEGKKQAIAIFSLQMVFNFLWSFLFFYFNNLLLAFIEIILLWGLILAMILKFYSINKWAAFINIPYLMWVSFASVLTGSIYFLNC